MSDSNEKGKEDQKDTTDKKYDDADLGYAYFPTRHTAFKDEKPVKKHTKWDFLKEDFLWNVTSRYNRKCEAYALDCIRYNPMVKMMLEAMKTHGCPINLRRHISCESCYQGVYGGFDSNINQVVICQNNNNKKSVCNLIAHELVHAFDKCRGKVNFNDARHVACTEIRAAALTSCTSYTGSKMGKIQLGMSKNDHIKCTKYYATQSLIAVKMISEEEALRVVNSVFDKCYNDKEPYGRIPQRKCGNMEQIISEGKLFGYETEKTENKKEKKDS